MPVTVIPLKFKVTDLWGLPQKLCAVYATGDGEFSKKLLLTDMNGEATVNWTLGSAEGKNEFTATIYNANKTVIKEILHSLQISGSKPAVIT
jgi:hypothetical protein